MTNQAIMAAYRASHNISEDTPLYTYAVWKQKGYIVKKGEHAKHRIVMHKYTPGSVDSEGNVKSAKCFGKTMHLFEFSQVEKIK